MATNLLSIDDLGASGIARVLDLADACEEISARPIPKVPTLRGRTVATLFFVPVMFSIIHRHRAPKPAPEANFGAAHAPA